MPSLKTISITILGTLVWASLLFAIGGQRPEYSLSYLLIAVNSLILAIPVAKILAGETPWYSMHAVALAGFAMYYILAPTAMLHYGVESEAFERQLTNSELSVALFITNLGLLAYVLGYRFGPKKKTLLPNRLEWLFTDTPQVQQNYNLATIIVFGFGISAWGYMFMSSGGLTAHLEAGGGARAEAVQSSGGYIFHIAKWAYVGALLYLARNKINVISIAMIGSLGLMLFYYNSRSLAFTLLIGAVIVYRFRFMQRFPLWMAAAGMSAIVFLQLFMRLLRGSGGNFASALTEQKTLWGSIDSFVLSTFGDMMSIRNLAEVIVVMPDKIPYQLGRTFLTLLYIIPGFIWRGQYHLITGANVIYVETFFEDRVGKISLSNMIILEFYMNFGWIGVIALMFACGMFVRWFQAVTIDNPWRKYQCAYIVYHAIMAIQIVRVIKSGVPTLLQFVYFLVPFLIVYLPNISMLFGSAPASTTGEDPDEPINAA